MKYKSKIAGILTGAALVPALAHAQAAHDLTALSGAIDGVGTSVLAVAGAVIASAAGLMAVYIGSRWVAGLFKRLVK